jgi:hypothetical protein
MARGGARRASRAAPPRHLHPRPGGGPRACRAAPPKGRAPHPPRAFQSHPCVAPTLSRPPAPPRARHTSPCTQGHACSPAPGPTAAAGRSHGEREAPRRVPRVRRARGGRGDAGPGVWGLQKRPRLRLHAQGLRAQGLRCVSGPAGAQRGRGSAWAGRAPRTGAGSGRRRRMQQRRRRCPRAGAAPRGTGRRSTCPRVRARALTRSLALSPAPQACSPRSCF